MGVWVAADDMRVAPLYKHIFPPAAAPRLAFLGLLFKSIRNVQFELQARLARGLQAMSFILGRKSMQVVLHGSDCILHVQRVLLGLILANCCSFAE